MPLNPEQPRQLKSREIARIMSSMWGNFIAQCDIEDVINAFNHFAEHRAKYEKYFRCIATGDLAELQKIVTDQEKGIVL